MSDVTHDPMATAAEKSAKDLALEKQEQMFSIGIRQTALTIAGENCRLRGITSPATIKEIAAGFEDYLLNGSTKTDA